MKRSQVVLLLLVSAACRADRGAAVTPSAPSSAASERVQAEDGLEIAYTERGAGSPTLVFLHGWCGDQRQWRDQVEAFADAHRVVTIDLGGHGLSGARRARWSLEALAGDVVAVADALALDDVVLVGHSMGAPVSLLAAARLPGRVRAVVGVASLHDVGFRIPDEVWRRQAAAFRDDFSGTLETFVESLFHESADPNLVARTKLDLSSAPPSVALPLFESFRAFDPVAALAAAGVPVRCINAALPPTNVAANRRHADFDALTVEGSGHYLMLERPAAFNAALRDVLASLDPNAMAHSHVQSLIPVLIVDAIEPQLDFWVERLGWEKTIEVPHEDALGFVTFAKDGVEVMYQTRASVAADVAALAAEPFHTALFVKVDDLDAVARALAGCEVVFERRETFYGSTEIAFRDPAGNPVTFARFPAER